MTLFSDFNTSNHEVEQRDNLGGFQVYDSGDYDAVIKAAFMNTAESGAKSIVFEFTLSGGQTYKEEIYFTNSEGKNYYMTKSTPPQKATMPGMVMVDNICLIATSKPLSAQNGEMKTFKVYSSKDKKEVTKEFPTLVDLTGQRVCLGILKILENKQEKGDDGKYHPTAVERESNRINAVFHPDLKITVVEAQEAKKKGVEPKAEFYQKWVDKNKGKPRDERDIKGGKGAVPSASDAPPASDRKPLFS